VPFPLKIRDADVQIVPVMELFAKSSRRPVGDATNSGVLSLAAGGQMVRPCF
jgi:hypothetical protein